MLAIGSSTFPRLVTAVAATWLCGTAPALAGAGGGAAGVIPALQQALKMVCTAVQMTSCPQFPSVTQLIVEISSLTNLPPEVVRHVNGISPAAAVNAGNPPQSARNPVFISIPKPIAFIGPPNNQGAAAATELYDSAADIFVYPVTTQSDAQPDMFRFVVDFLPRMRQTFENGENVAEISLPLVVLNGDSERLVPTTVQIRAACSGGPDCLTADAVGDFIGSGTPQKHAATELGLNVSLTFGPSPVSIDPHAIFEVDVGLIVTRKNNPAYFRNPISPAIAAAFSAEDRGLIPAFLGQPIGFAPDAAVVTAQISRGGDDAHQTGANRTVVTAVVAISTDGEALASAALP